MTYVVVENCIKCKYMDCVEVCPVDCFYEGENMLVIHPDECIDCGVCEPECPAEAIKPDTEPGLEKWLSLNADYAKSCPNTDQLVKNMHFTPAMEDSIMDDILNAKAEPDAAAAKYLKANPAVIDAWLAGVTTADGKPGAAAVKSSVGL